MERSKLILWFGSLQDLAYKEQVQTLCLLSESLTDKDRLLVSLDITNEPELVHNAYLDQEGHSARLYYNSVVRLNREYGSNFDLNKFVLIGEFHQTSDPDQTSQFKARLRSLCQQIVDIPGLGLTIDLKDGEFLNLYEGEGTSCKYTMEQINSLMRKGNFHIRKQWFCENSHVAFTLV